MNILCINGSPKGAQSNTLRLTHAFLEGISDAQPNGSVTIRQLDISRLEIRPCLGCFSCWKRTPGQCCIQDDMHSVLESILWADITIWSFPLYYFSLPGKLKTVLDRQLPLSLPFMVSGANGGGHPSRYDMGGKKTVLISTCGFYTPSGNYDSITAQFDRICGKGNYTTLFCGEGELFRVPELSARTNAYLALVRQAGQEYISGCIQAETQEKLQQPLFPRDVFEKMADASWGISQTGQREDSSLTFTKQMAALYNPASYSGSDILLDMDYTDIGKRYRIVLGKNGSHLTDDFSQSPTTVIHTPFTVWQAIAAGEIEGSTALMQHRYSVEGDFNLLLKWDDYFGQSSPTQAASGKALSGKASNMCGLLIPWIVFWIAGNIHPFWGASLSVFTCCLVPVLFFRNQKTIYDALSGAIVCIFSLALLAGISAGAIMPLSYAAFGLMWSLSACLKTPLSAEYSKNSYGGDKALENPIFIKTNRILSAAWGILYLTIPILTYWMIPASARVYGQILNYVLPAVMGAFTAWFQKWYPAKVAKGA